MALAYIGKNDLDSAKDKVEKAIEFDSTNVTILKEYGRILKAYNSYVHRSSKDSINQPSDSRTENDFVIVPEKLNVFYRGIQNPISIYLMGLKDKVPQSTVKIIFDPSLIRFLNPFIVGPYPSFCLSGI